MSRSNRDREQARRRRLVEKVHALHDAFGPRGLLNIYRIIDDPQSESMDAPVGIPVTVSTQQESTGQQLRAAHVIDPVREWLVQKGKDVYMDVKQLYHFCGEYLLETWHQKDKGFPVVNSMSFIYKFHGEDVYNASEYVEKALQWIDSVLYSRDIFIHDGIELSDGSVNSFSEIFKQLARLYAIMYSSCMPTFDYNNAVEYLNTGFKFFYYLTQRYDSEVQINYVEFAPFDSEHIKKYMDLDALRIEYERDSTSTEVKVTAFIPFAEEDPEV